MNIVTQLVKLSHNDVVVGITLLHQFSMPVKAHDDPVVKLINLRVSIFESYKGYEEGIITTIYHEK